MKKIKLKNGFIGEGNIPKDFTGIVEDSFGEINYYKNGRSHSFDDKPAVVYGNGEKFWYKDGKIHRDGDKPAYVGLTKHRVWFKNDDIHRGNGKPALIHPDGKEAYFINGKRVSQKAAEVYFLLFREEQKKEK